MTFFRGLIISFLFVMSGCARQTYSADKITDAQLKRLVDRHYTHKQLIHMLGLDKAHYSVPANGHDEDYTVNYQVGKRTLVIDYNTLTDEVKDAGFALEPWGPTPNQYTPPAFRDLPTNRFGKPF